MTKTDSLMEGCSMTDWKALCRELVTAVESNCKETVINHDLNCAYMKADAALVQPEPTLTVEDCNNMRKHAGNYIAEDLGVITLDGYFTREDLIEIANTVPR